MIRVLGFGAGVQTVALARMALAGEVEPLDAMVFADTGGEVPDTYQAAAEIEAACAAAGARFVRVRNHAKRSGGDLYGDLMAADRPGLWAAPPLFVRNPDGTAGFTRRQCTGDFKIDPINRALKQLAGIGRRRKFADGPVVEHWMGISRDEVQRQKVSTDAWRVFRYPLIERGMDRRDCEAWLLRHGFGVPPKSACYFCPYQSDRRWSLLRQQHPGLWAKAVALDERLRDQSGAMKIHGTPYLHRALKPLGELAHLTAQDDLFADECAGVCGV